MKRAILALAAAVMLFAPGTAFAGCGFVVAWRQITTYPHSGRIDGAWEPTSTYKDVEECDKATAEVTMAMIRRSFQPLQPGEVRQTWDLRCLPETIDPRGTKESR